jgi:hypothetical protein
VSVEISETSVRGSTDTAGTFSFVIDEVGEYTLILRKTGFEDYNEKFVVYGVLKVSVNPETLGLDNEVAIVVSDKDGNRIEADIAIMRPDGDKETFRKSSHTFKPDTAGGYTVNVSREFYLTATGGFTVAPYPIELSVTLNSRELSVKATSNGRVAADASLLVITPDGEEHSLKTDSTGVAKLDISGLNQTGTFTVKSNDRNYESKTVEKDAGGIGSNIWPMLILGIAMIMVLGLVVLAVFLIGHKRSKVGRISSSGKGRRKSSGLGKT